MSDRHGEMDLDVELWVQRAEEDRMAAMQLDPAVLPGIVAFHCQQCAEKYLKALIVAHWTVPRKTHNLLEIAQQACDVEEDLPDLTESLAVLNPYSVDIRYPGPDADEAAAANAVAAMERVRPVLREALGLETPEEGPEAEDDDADDSDTGDDLAETE